MLTPCRLETFRAKEREETHERKDENLECCDLSQLCLLSRSLQSADKSAHSTNPVRTKGEPTVKSNFLTLSQVIIVWLPCRCSP